VIQADGRRTENSVSFDFVKGFWKDLYSMSWYLEEASHLNVVSSPNEAFRQRPGARHSRRSPQIR
jgi:hypothetical protein